MPDPINRRGTGSIFKACDHTTWDKCKCQWSIRFYDVHGSQRERTGFPNKTEAWNRLGKIKEEKNQAKGAGRATPKEDPRFSEFMEKRIARRRRTSEDSKRTYRANMRLHVNPNIGNRRLSMFREKDLFDLVERLEGSGLHPSTINNIMASQVIPAFKAAGRQGLCSLDFDELSELLPEYTRKRRYCPSHDEIVAIAESSPPKLRFAIYLMAGCGLRIGEALAVKEECFIAPGVLRVSEQWKPTSRYAPLKHRKYGDYRDIPLPEFVDRVREEHLDRDLNKGGVYFPAFRGNHPVLSTRYAHMLIRDTVAACQLTPEITAHNFRHAFATYAISGGAQIPEVAMWLGHQDINMTYRVYGHLVKPSFDRARTIMDDFLMGV